MSEPRQILIDPLSTQSLFLRLVVNGLSLSTATGFIVAHKERHFLVTNWHVLAGRDPDTEELLSPTAAVPDTVEILHHKAGVLGTWTTRAEPLLRDDGSPRWMEHPAGRLLDVVLLPLTQLDSEVRVNPFNLSLADADIVPQVAMPVSIIGYPLGMRTGGAWPIWKTGHIASDPDVDYDSRPAFLIDATTRGGMSGSPVVLRMSGGYTRRNGDRILASNLATLFLGIYSGRIHENAEIGRVWRPSVLQQILMCI